MRMSNDIKLVAQGILAGAAGSSARGNVAQIFRPEALFRHACPQFAPSDMFLSGVNVARPLTGEAFAFSKSARPQPAAAVSEKRRIPSLAPIKLNRQTPLFKIRCKLLKTNDRPSLKSPKNSKMEHPDFRPFSVRLECPSRSEFSRRFRFRPFQHAELAHRSELAARRRSQGPHRNLIVELLRGEVGDQAGTDCLVNFLNSGLQSSLASKIQNSLHLLERDPIVPPVRILDSHNFCVWDHSRDGRSELVNLKIQG